MIDWKPAQVSVLPAKAGIQAILALESKVNLDAGFRRHDKIPLRLKHVLSAVEEARDSKHHRYRLTAGLEKSCEASATVSRVDIPQDEIGKFKVVVEDIELADRMSEIAAEYEKYLE